MQSHFLLGVNIMLLSWRYVVHFAWKHRSVSRIGSEFPEYAASKGGVLTPLNECIINGQKLWAQIMDETPLRRWATTEEIARWAYFLTVANTFCTGQSIVADGGESINHKFIWKD